MAGFQRRLGQAETAEQETPFVIRTYGLWPERYTFLHLSDMPLFGGDDVVERDTDGRLSLQIDEAAADDLFGLQLDRRFLAQSGVVDRMRGEAVTRGRGEQDRPDIG